MSACVVSVRESGTNKIGRQTEDRNFCRKGFDVGVFAFSLATLLLRWRCSGPADAPARAAAARSKLAETRSRTPAIFANFNDEPRAVMHPAHRPVARLREFESLHGERSGDRLQRSSCAAARKPSEKSDVVNYK